MKNKQLFICGSSAKMLNSNYFQRKVAPNSSTFLNIILIVDSYIFHDAKENKLWLAPDHKIKKIKETYAEWDRFLFNTLEQYNNTLNISKIKKWDCLRCSQKRFWRFLCALDETRLQIDVTNCPCCGHSHTGPFEVLDGKSIKLPCSKGSVGFDRLQKTNVRLKKGYLQLYVAYLQNGLVLVSDVFIKNNRTIIKKLGLQSCFFVQNKKNCRSQTMSLDDYINNFESSYIHVMHGRSLVYYVKKMGGYTGCMYFTRHKLRQLGCYRMSDVVRNTLKKSNIFINDEKQASTIIIKKRRL